MMARVESITSERIDITNLFYTMDSPSAADRNSVVCQASHEERGAVQDHQQNPDDEVKSRGGDAGDRKRLSAILIRIVFDLHQLISAQDDGYDAADHADATAPAEGDGKDAAAHRGNRQPLLGRLRI